MFDYEKMDHELVTRKANLRQIEALCVQAPQMLEHIRSLLDWYTAMHAATKVVGTSYLPDEVALLHADTWVTLLHDMLEKERTNFESKWVPIGLAPLCALVEEKAK